MERFEEIAHGIYLLKIPFGAVWTGVVLVRGAENVLIDSGGADPDVEQFILPALADLGMCLSDIHILTNTHSHGDHIGGHHRLRQIGAFRVAAFSRSAPKVEDPVPYAVATRTRFPEFSPKPQSFLKGTRVDVTVEDGGTVGDRLQVIYTPGHDDDCVCFYDKPTKTLITGDSLQGNGTVCQGIAFYKSLPDYLQTLDRLGKTDIENILCGHDYDRIGWRIAGRENVRDALNTCLDAVHRYAAFVENAVRRGITRPELLASQLIDSEGCGRPEWLFMALYTVTEHINHRKELGK